MRLAALPMVLAALTAASGAAAQVTCDVFDVLSRVESGTLIVSIETDLPEETMLNVEVTRAYWLKGRRGSRSVEYFFESSPVSKWTRERRIDVSKDRLDALLKKALSRRGPRGEVDRIAPRLKLRIITPASQPLEAFGERNLKLSGRKVRRDGLFHCVREILYFEVPGGGGTDAPTPPDALEPGSVYLLLGSAALEPHSEPADADRAARRVVQLPYKTQFLVDRRVRGPKGPGYRVRAYDLAGQLLGSGWLAVASLGRHEPRRTEGLVFPAKKRDAELETWRLGPETPRSKLMGQPHLETRPNGVLTVTADVVVPSGLTHQQLEWEARYQAWELIERHQADAAAVRLHRGGVGTEAGPSAGQAILAPRGRMNVRRPAKPGAMRFRIKVPQRYFDPLPETLARETPIVVEPSGRFVAKLRAAPWPLDAEDDVLNVTSGTKGSILDVRIYTPRSGDVVRYLIRTRDGKEGWADAADVKAR